MGQPQHIETSDVTKYALFKSKRSSGEAVRVSPAARPAHPQGMRAFDAFALKVASLKAEKKIAD